jgi:hypothetical protein
MIPFCLSLHQGGGWLIASGVVPKNIFLGRVIDYGITVFITNLSILKTSLKSMLARTIVDSRASAIHHQDINDASARMRMVQGTPGFANSPATPI